MIASNYISDGVCQSGGTHIYWLIVDRQADWRRPGFHRWGGEHLKFIYKIHKSSETVRTRLRKEMLPLTFTCSLLVCEEWLVFNKLRNRCMYHKLHSGHHPGCCWSLNLVSASGKIHKTEQKLLSFCEIWWNYWSMWGHIENKSVLFMFCMKFHYQSFPCLKFEVKKAL